MSGNHLAIFLREKCAHGPKKCAHSAKFRPMWSHCTAPFCLTFVLAALAASEARAPNYLAYIFSIVSVGDISVLAPKSFGGNI
jgi:hypothetical protein